MKALEILQVCEILRAHGIAIPRLCNKLEGIDRFHDINPNPKVCEETKDMAIDKSPRSYKSRQTGASILIRDIDR